MSRATGALSPIPSPLEAVHDEVASAIANATPLGAFESGFRRLQTLASEHPEFELSVIGALKNVKAELMTLAAAPNGGPRIDLRLRQLENELRSRVARPNIYTPMPSRPSAFPTPPPPKYPAGIADPRAYPALRLLDELNAKLKRGSGETP